MILLMNQFPFRGYCNELNTDGGEGSQLQKSRF